MTIKYLFKFLLKSARVGAIYKVSAALAWGHSGTSGLQMQCLHSN